MTSSYLKKHSLFLFCLAVYLISSVLITFFTAFQFLNLTPHPDTLFYLSGAKTFLQTGKIALSYDSINIFANVPILYPLFLSIPLFFLSNYHLLYLVNLVLGILTFLIFYLLAKSIIKNKLILLAALLLYCTNFLLSWYPALIMAENLLLFLFILAIYLLNHKLNVITLIFLSLLPILFIATKYVAWPISFILTLLVFLKVWTQQKNRLQNLLTFLFLSSLSLLIYSLLEQSLIHNNPITRYLYTLNSFTQNEIILQNNQDTPLFHPNYLSGNIARYLAGLIGAQISLANRETYLFAPFLAIFGLVGLKVSFITKKYIFIQTFFWLSLFITVGYLVFFIAVDARYLIPFIPGIILFACLLFDQFMQLPKSNNLKIVKLISNILLLFLLVSNLFILKKEIQLLNTKSDQYQIYQAATIMLNETKKDNEIFLISIIPPYYLTLFTEEKVNWLPLSSKQQFAKSTQLTKEINSTAELLNLYQQLLENKQKIYISNFSASERYFYNLDWQKIEQQFSLVEVRKGCNNDCNLYELKLNINK